MCNVGIPAAATAGTTAGNEGLAVLQHGLGAQVVSDVIGYFNPFLAIVGLYGIAKTEPGGVAAQDDKIFVTVDNQYRAVAGFID